MVYVLLLEQGMTKTLQRDYIGVVLPFSLLATSKLKP